MVIQYKCPTCGSDMSFDSKSGMLLCESCNRTDSIDQFPNDSLNNTFSDNEINEYICKNCGAQIITDADTAATTCSFCGAGVVLGDRVSGALAPTKVIPFTINKTQAQEAFKAWCKKGLVTPKGFLTADRIKNITGIYVPFWLFDMKCCGDFSAHCTKVKSYTKGDYIYTETSYYEVYKQLDLNFSKIPADASTKMDDSLMDALEPFDYDNLKKFNTPYLAGYLAEKYNYTDEELMGRITSRTTDFVDTYNANLLSEYATVNYNNKNLSYKKTNAEYTFLPVWMVAYNYKDKDYVFAMNGQTGKVVGSPPISSGRVAAWFLGISGGIFLSAQLISLIATIIGILGAGGKL